MSVTEVKFCGMTRLKDAEHAAELGAWAVGLIFWPGSPRRCSPGAATEIAATLRRRLEGVGVFVNPTLGELARTAWELPAQFDEPWRSGDVLQTALHAAGRATAAGARHPDLAVNEIAAQVRSIAIDLVKASEASETAHSALIEAPTEELLAAVPLPAAS